MRSASRARQARRIGAAATAVALAGLVLAAPVPAQAVAGAGTVGAWADISSAGGTCSDVADVEQTASFSTDGKSVTRSATSSGTVVDSGDAGDTTTVAASSKVTFRSTEVNGSFASATFTASLSASVTAAQGAGSGCNAAAGASGTADGALTVARGGWLTIALAAADGLETNFVLSPNAEVGSVVIGTAGGETDIASTVWMDAGLYDLSIETGADAGVPGSDKPAAVSGTVKVTATMAEAGSAAGPAVGPGKKYVGYAGTRNCVDRTVAVTFTGAAKKLSKATFYVNGKKRQALANPPAKVSLLLPVPVGDTAATVKVVLLPDKPQGKKGKKPKPIIVTRTYLACS